MLLQGTNSINKVIIFGMFAVAFFAVHIYLYRYKKLPYEFKKEKKPMDMVEEEVKNDKNIVKDSKKIQKETQKDQKKTGKIR
jgi:hypothetical protein